MRTLALAIAVSVCLGTSAAHAVCTTGVECIRERFGIDQTIRNNRIIDRTDGLGDRGRPLNPYLAGQNAANQARRAGRFDATTADAAARRSAAEARRSGEVLPDARYTPGAPIPGQAPFEPEDTPELTVERYDPALPVTDGPSATGRQEETVPRSRTTRPAPAEPASAQRDQNMPRGAADLRYSGPRPAGSTR